MEFGNEFKRPSNPRKPEDSNQEKIPQQNLEDRQKRMKYDSALNALEDGNLGLFEHRILEFNDEESDEFQESNERTNSACQKGIISLLNKKPDEYLTKISFIKDFFGIENSFFYKSEFQEDAQETLLYLVKEGKYFEMLAIQEIFGVSEEIFKSEKAKEFAQEGFLPFLKENNLNNILKYNKSFKIPNEVWYSKEAQEIVEDNIVELLGYNDPNYDDIYLLAEAFKISENVLKSSKFQDKAKRAIAINIENGKSGDADLLVEMFGISKDYSRSSEIQEIFKKDFLEMLKSYDTEDYLEFSKHTQITDEVFYSNEAQEIIEDKIVDLLFVHPKPDWERISLLLNTFKIASERLERLSKFHEPSKIAVENYVKSGEIEKAKEVGRVFGISEDFIKNLKQKK